MLGELSESIGVDTRTFQSWLTPDDQIEMIRLGWNPFGRKLKPPVVRYLRDKFIDPELKRQETEPRK